MNRGPRRPTWTEYVAAHQRIAGRSERRRDLPGVVWLPPTDDELAADRADRSILNAYRRARVAP